MIKRNSQAILVSLVALIFGLLGYAVLSHFYFNEERVITLTDKGFKPKEIEIKVGETVTFRNKTDKMFWPAADIHPYHSDYSAFDPQRPLGQDEEWSFTFERLGKWNFHDHISPNFTGAITVRSADGRSGGACYDINDEACWTNIISSTLKAEGIDAAFLELKLMHESNMAFITNCHNYGHDIGLKSYQFFGTDVELSEKTGWCNAGFYHGFMEGFVEDESDPKKIDEFCTWVGETTNSKFGLAEAHCRHGIGHGALEALLFENTYTGGDPIESVNQAMDLCYATSHDDESVLMRCVWGAYDTFRNWLFDPKGPPDRELVETMLDFCVPYDEWYIKFACYHELSKMITYLPGQDYSEVVFDFRKEIAPQDFEEFGPVSIRAFAMNLGKRGVKEKSFEDLIGLCRTADLELQESCILGMFDGLQFAGTPGEEYKVSSQFCAHELLSEEEKAACFFNFQEEVFYTYASERWPEICKLVPAQYINPGRSCELSAI